MKPTTTKNALKYFEINHITYKPRPSFAFYNEYKKVILDMKSQVNNISQDNTTFTGFLIMGMGMEMVREG